jgi:hypothetical protein
MTQYDALSFETAGEMGVKSHTHPHRPPACTKGKCVMCVVCVMRHWRGAKPVIR